jgi:hypothetical protein
MAAKPGKSGRKGGGKKGVPEQEQGGGPSRHSPEGTQSEQAKDNAGLSDQGEDETEREPSRERQHDEPRTQLWG